MTTTAKVSVVIGLAAATIIGLQTRHIYVQEQTVKQLDAQVASQTESNRVLQAQIANLQERVASYVKTMDGMSRDAAKSRGNARSARDANQRAEAAMKAAAQARQEGMFTPEMYKAMRPQTLATQKVMYGPLVRRLGLSPEKADKFYDILLDNGEKALEAGNGGKGDPKSMEADLQALLGESGLAQFNDYTKYEMAGQSMLAVMRNDFADHPLNQAQEQQLLQAMKTARQQVPLDYSQIASQVAASDNEAATDLVWQQQEKINQKVLEQAGGFLSPDQLQILGTSQSNMLAQQKAAAPMLRKMFSKPPGTP